MLVERVEGSAPREAGAWMRVSPTGTEGSIGGGAAEHRAIAEARAMLGEAAPEPRRLDLALGPEIDQCCGGRLHLALAAGAPGPGAALWPGGPALPGEAPRRPVILYGAGHVGEAVARALTPLPFALTWVDTRPGLPPPGPWRAVTAAIPEAEARAAPADAFHLVLTHSHAADLEIVTAAMERGFAFLGLIGSATKRATFLRRLAERGIAEETRARLVCPIGLPGIPGKAPEIIAASVAAQLLAEDARLARLQEPRP